MFLLLEPRTVAIKAPFVPGFPAFLFLAWSMIDFSKVNIFLQVHTNVGATINIWKETKEYENSSENTNAAADDICKLRNLLSEPITALEPIIALEPIKAHKL